MTLAEYNLGVDEFADRVYRFVLKQLQPEDARDIVQESFARLWAKKDEIAFEKMRAYLFSIAYHAVIDFYRREKHRRDYLRDLPNEETHERIGHDLKPILNNALARLPEIQRSVILLRDYEGYAYQEIEEITGLKQSQVKVYIYRGRMALKEYLGSVETII